MPQTNLYDVPGGCGAAISADGLYRYRLWRRWDDLLPLMVWVMLNPSTADGTTDDPTIRKCIGFAKANHCGGITVVNLFAFRATDPKQLPKVADPVGPENDQYIVWSCCGPERAVVVAAWGTNLFARTQASRVRKIIHDNCTRELQCFGASKTGQPYHPLYLPYSTPMQAL